MPDVRFAKLAAQLLARVPRGVAMAPPPPDSEREVDILALKEALEGRKRRNRRQVVLTVGGAATALAVAAAFVLMLLQEKARAPFGKPGTQQVAQTQSIHAWGTDVPDGATVRAGQRLNARGVDGARLSFSGGTELRLTHESRIHVKAIGSVQAFRLARGRLHAEVAPLGTGQRFLIETPDGEIEVHGTVFELAVVPPQPGCSVATTTRVSVSRGVVEVRSAGRDDHIRAGEHWPPECEALTGLSGSSSPTAGVSPTARDRGRAAAPPPIHRGVPKETRAPTDRPSELTAQNDLFAQSMAAKRRGQLAQAHEGLDKLIVRFPRGPLAEAAHVERMRVRKQMGNEPSAQRGAHEYLREFPNGFARAEAHLILGLGP
jgi:hypothetical protein